MTVLHKPSMYPTSRPGVYASWKNMDSSARRLRWFLCRYCSLLAWRISLSEYSLLSISRWWRSSHVVRKLRMSFRKVARLSSNASIDCDGHDLYFQPKVRAQPLSQNGWSPITVVYDLTLTVENETLFAVCCCFFALGASSVVLIVELQVVCSEQVMGPVSAVTWLLCLCKRWRREMGMVILYPFLEFYDGMVLALFLFGFVLAQALWSLPRFDQTFSSAYESTKQDRFGGDSKTHGNRCWTALPPVVGWQTNPFQCIVGSILYSILYYG